MQQEVSVGKVNTLYSSLSPSAFSEAKAPLSVLPPLHTAQDCPTPRVCKLKVLQFLTSTSVVYMISYGERPEAMTVYHAQLLSFIAGPIYMNNHPSCTHTDPLFPVINADFILLPVDGRLRVSTRWLALQYGRLSSCHHNICRVLAEVIS